MRGDYPRLPPDVPRSRRRAMSLPPQAALPANPDRGSTARPSTRYPYLACARRIARAERTCGSPICLQASLRVTLVRQRLKRLGRKSPAFGRGVTCFYKADAGAAMRHQKSGATACGTGRADVPGKKEFGLSAQISSVSGPSAALASWATRSIGSLRTAASYCRKR
jgi:hypothetical protein